MKKIYYFLASWGLSVVLLFLLFVLVLFGTLEQVNQGLFEVQKKYFESMFVVHWIGPVPLPLPGVYLLLGLLSINLVFGAIVRGPKNWRRPGMLIAHGGILLMVLAGFVTYHFSINGYMTLYEKESSAVFESFHEWEMAIIDTAAPGKEFVIPEREFARLDDGRTRLFQVAALPFDLRLKDYSRNCTPRKPVAGQEKGVEGILLEAMPLDKEAERNTPGVYATVIDKSTNQAQEGVLWGQARAPWTVAVAGRQFSIDLRRRQWKAPFSITLLKFTHELYPGTGIAKNYMSTVTMTDGNDSRKVEIKMNEPLRHKGYTFFQSSWGPQNAAPGTPLFSQFAVVHNPADQWPLYSCLVITFGLTLHFLQKLLRYLRAENKRRALAAAVPRLIVAAALLLGGLAAYADEAAKDAPTPQWDKDSLNLLATLPIQESGRIKPLDTFAQFTMLKINGKRSYRAEEGPSMQPMEWLADVLLYPETAQTFPTFVVDSSEAIVAIGVLPHDSKRDRYSYKELATGRDTLLQLADTYSAIPEKNRNRVQQQVVNLATNLRQFEDLAHFFDFARKRFTVSGDTLLAKAFPEKDGVPLSVVLQRLPAVLRDLQTQAPGLDEAAHKAEREAVKKFLHEVDEAASSAQGMTLLPPILPDDKLWRSPADVFGSLIDLNANAKEPVDLIADLERLVAARADHTAFRAALETVHKDVVARATARGEYRKVPIEVSFYRGQYFFYSQWLYVFSFLLIAISWLMAQRRWLHWTTVAAVAIPTLYLIVGIAFRCIIRGRPPVTTLYETLLFSTAVAVVVALAIEVMTRQRIGIAAASILGSLGLFVAYRYEAKEAVDTMPSMVAVLDTNFWLATHVTTVTAGYGAGLLASAIAHIYILGKALGIKRNDTAFYAAIGRMVYGALCFGLVFATIGTVLGGIWANESWGRFWGWDPKENGALLICLWGLIVLHARGGGYIGTLATCVSCVILGMVTAFSWWGVNLLGVGLHSYGFTSGILSMLVIFWAIETVVAALGWVAMKRNGADPIAAAKGDGEL